jgi:hypothetical protein
MRFFTDKSIAEMFEDAGYEVLTLEGINSSGCLEIRNICNSRS